MTATALHLLHSILAWTAAVLLLYGGFIALVIRTCQACTKGEREAHEAGRYKISPEPIQQITVPFIRVEVLHRRR